MKKLLAVFATVGLALSLMVTAVNAQDDGTGRPFRDRPHVGVGLLRDVVEVIATETGLTPIDLLQEIRQTEQTIAEIITAHGGSVEDVTAQLVASLTEDINTAVTNGRLPQERADELLSNLESKVVDALNRDPQRGAVIERGMRGLLGDRALMSAVETATGLTAREVLMQVRDGKTLGEVITENGGDPQVVIAETIAAMSEQLSTAVENGRMTQEQADERLSRAEIALNDLMSGTLREHLRESI